MKVSDALEGAIAMLREIAAGKTHDFRPGTTAAAKLRAYEKALEEHHIVVMQDERRRAQIRELADQTRAQRKAAA